VTHAHTHTHTHTHARTVLSKINAVIFVCFDSFVCTYAESIQIMTSDRVKRVNCMFSNFHNCTVHLETIKSFIYPTECTIRMFQKNVKTYIKIYIKSAPTCFGFNVNFNVIFNILLEYSNCAFSWLNKRIDVCSVFVKFCACGTYKYIHIYIYIYIYIYI
jgi:hypothetical protein